MTRLPFLIALVSAAGMAACSHRESEPPARSATPAEVTIATVRQEELPLLTEAGGIIRARTVASIASRILAPVVAVEAAPGDRVRSGARLVVLDGRELDAHSERAAAGLAAASRAADAAAAEQEAAESGLALATATHGRIAGLHARQSVTNQELDEATAALQSAQARLKGAQARVAEAASGLRAAEAAEKAASVSASYAVLAAPFDGIVTEKLVEPGNMAAPGMPLLRIEDPTLYRLEVVIDEARATLVSEGQAVDVLPGGTGSAPNGTPLQGRIAEVSRAFDAGSHSFRVKVDLPRDESLRSGAFARVRLPGPSRTTLTIPASSIVERGQLRMVFGVGEDGYARIRLVHVGTQVGDRVEVLAGLEPGETVVVDPPADLVDGRPVTVSEGGRTEVRRYRDAGRTEVRPYRDAGRTDAATGVLLALAGRQALPHGLLGERP